MWNNCFVSTKEHFYHVGGKEENRNAVYEALLSNVQIKHSVSNEEMRNRLADNNLILTTQKEVLYKPLQLAFNLD